MAVALPCTLSEALLRWWNAFDISSFVSKGRTFLESNSFVIALWQWLDVGLQYMSEMTSATVQFASRHPYVCIVNLLLLFLHLYILQPKRSHNSVGSKHRPDSRKPSRFLSSPSHQLQTNRPNIKVDKVPICSKGLTKLERKPQDALPTKRICYQTRLRSSGSRRGYRWDVDAPYRLPSNILHHCPTGFTKLAGPETSEDEASTLNEVTWTNEPSSAQFRAHDVSPEFGLARPRWVVDKLSDVPEETERTTSQRQDSPEEDVFLGLTSLQEDGEGLDGERREEEKEVNLNQTGIHKEMLSEEGVGTPVGGFRENMVGQDARRFFSKGQQYRRYRSRSENSKPLENKTGRVQTPKKQHIKRTLGETKVESSLVSQQAAAVDYSKGHHKNSGQKDTDDGRIQDKELSHLGKIQMNISPRNRGDRHRASRHQSYLCQESNMADANSTEQNHPNATAKKNLLPNKQESDELGTFRQRRSPFRTGNSHVAINGRGILSRTSGEDLTSTTAENQSKQVNIKPNMSPRILGHTSQGSDRASLSIAPENSALYGQPEYGLDGQTLYNRPRRPTARSRMFLTLNRSSRRRGRPGVMGCKLTCGSNTKSEWPNQDPTQKQRSERGTNRLTETYVQNQHCVSGSSVSCGSSVGERKLLGNRSEATLVGKRDSWIWFSHEHKPSLENFATRQRRFHSHDPRVAELAAEIRRQEEMNKDIEREAGSIVATPCIMLSRVHLGKHASINQLMKDAVMSTSTQHVTQGTSCQTSIAVSDTSGNLSRDQQGQGPRHRSPSLTNPTKHTLEESTRLSRARGLSPTNTVAKDLKNQRSKSISNSPVKVRRYSPKRLHAQKKNKEDSVPGILLISPIKSSSTSSHKTTPGLHKTQTETTKSNTGSMACKGANEPSLSPCQLDLLPGREGKSWSSCDRSRNKLQDKVDLQPSRSDPEMSCASTKASTASLLDLGPRSDATESYFDGEDPVSTMESYMPSHVYSVQSPPKTRQERRAKERLGESTLSLGSLSTNSNSSKRYHKGMAQSARDVKTTPSTRARSNYSPFKTSVDNNQRDKTANDSKLKSPHTQSLTTSTVASSESVMPRGRMATLRQSVLNNEVTDSIQKYLFETNDRSSSSYSPTRKLTRTSNLGNGCSKDSFRQASESTTVTEVESFTSKKNLLRQGKTHVNVFSPGYYLKKRTLHRQASVSPSYLNRSQYFLSERQRSQSFDGQRFVTNDDNNSKTLRRSASLQQYDSNTSDQQIVESKTGKAVVLQENKNTALGKERAKLANTGTVDNFLNRIRSTPFEDTSDKQDGILEVEQPILQDIESECEEDSEADHRVLCGDKMTENVEHEEIATKNDLPSESESLNRVKAHMSSQEPLLISHNMRDITNSHSAEYNFPEKPLNQSDLVKELAAQTANEECIPAPLEPECEEKCDLKQRHAESKDGTSKADISKEKGFCPEKQEVHATNTYDCVQTEITSKLEATTTVCVSPTVTSSLRKAGKLGKTYKEERPHKNFSEFPNSSQPYGQETVKDNVKTAVKNVHGKFARRNLVKRHIPVSALIADISDICNRQQPTTPTPGTLAAASPLSSNVSLVEKYSKTSLKRQGAASRESNNTLESVDKSNPVKHAAQNVSHLRRVHNFYGKRQMRITRSVGLVHPIRRVDTTDFTTNEHLMNFDSHACRSNDGTLPKQTDIDTVETFNDDHSIDVHRNKEGTIPTENTNDIATPKESGDTEKPDCKLLQEAKRSKSIVYKPFRKNKILSRKVRSSNSLGVRFSKAETTGHNELPFHALVNSNVDLLEKAAVQLANKNSESGSTNNSSNNLPHQRDMLCTSRASSTSICCTDQTQSLILRSRDPSVTPHLNSGGCQPAKRYTLSSSVKTKSECLASSRNKTKTKGITWDLTNNIKQCSVKNAEYITKPQRNITTEEVDKNRCNLPLNVQTTPLTRLAEPRFLCRQNVSSSLRKAHAIAKRKGENQMNPRGSPKTALVPCYRMSKTKSPVCNARFGKKSEYIVSCGEENVQRETANATKNLDSLQTEPITILRPNLLISSIGTCNATSTHSPAKFNQLNSHGDSGFDETLSMSERTRDQTYSLTDRLAQTHSFVESQAKPTVIAATGEDKISDDCIRSVMAQALEDGTVSENDGDENIAFKISNGCVEQETSSIDTEEVFSSRANSFWEETESIEEQKEIQEDLPQKPQIDTAEGLSIPKFENKPLIKAVHISPEVYPTHVVNVHSKPEPEKEIAGVLEKPHDSIPTFIEQYKSRSCGSIRVSSAAQNTYGETRKLCRKTMSSVDIIGLKNSKRFSKSNQSLSSISPLLATGHNSPVQTNDRIEHSLPATTQCNLHETSIDIEGDINHVTSDKIPTVSDQISPSLDCLCVWTSSPCQCGFLETTSSLTTSSESLERSAGASGSDSTPNGKTKGTTKECKNHDFRVDLEDARQHVTDFVDQGPKEVIISRSINQGTKFLENNTLSSKDFQNVPGSLILETRLCEKIERIEENETGLYEKVEIIEESNDQKLRLVEEALQVALPPTSSDEEDDGECADTENEHKLQENKNSISFNVESNTVSSVTLNPIGESVSTLSSEPFNILTCDEAESQNLSHDGYENQERPIKNTGLCASFHTETEKKAKDHPTPLKAKSEIITPLIKPRAKRRQLPGTIHCSENRSTNLSEFNTHDDNLHTLNSGTEHKVLSHNESPLSAASRKAELLIIAKSNSSVTPNNSVPKGVKIEKRSVAFQDLLKRF